jgi:hypothetical protein
LFDELVAEAAEDAEGEHGAAVNVRRDTSELEGRAAEAAELVAKRLLGEGVFLSCGAGLIGG